MKPSIKYSLTTICFAVGFTFYQSFSQTGTGEIGKQVQLISDNLVTQNLLRTTDEKEVQGGKDTNGWSCVLRISNRPWASNQKPPVCSVLIENITTNTLYCWGGKYGEIYSKIELFNSKGDPVERTDEGKQIGTWASHAKIQEMVKDEFKAWVSGKVRTPGFSSIRPGRNCGIGFCIRDLFALTKSGEYTLKVQACMIQNVGGEEYNPELKITWVPELTAKVQIRPEDIPPESLLPAGQTNSLAK